VKKISGLLYICIVPVIILSCGGSGGGGGDGAPDSTPPEITVTKTGSGIKAITEYELPAGTFFNMIQATPDTIDGSIRYPNGTDDQYPQELTTPFIIAETLTTYDLWETVYDWAINNGYTFANAGTNGYNNTSDSTEHPVVMINWRDAIVWCNALTEYYNAKGGSPALDCVYYTDSTYNTPLRISTNSTAITYNTAGTEDAPYIKASTHGNTDMAYCTAKGFRLPTSNEYEFAARYQGSDNSNAVSRSGLFWTRGNSASGAAADYKNAAATGEVAVYGVTSTATVKSRKANSLGLYDMSGNAWAWCLDYRPDLVTHRIIRGGACNLSGNYIDRLQVGYWFAFTPYNTFTYGIRLARSM